MCKSSISINDNGGRYHIGMWVIERGKNGERAADEQSDLGSGTKGMSESERERENQAFFSSAVLCQQPEGRMK